MVQLPTRVDTIANLIYQGIESAHKEERRQYLGGSQIGDSCSRKLWYDFRWFKQTQYDGRLLRLFRTGHLQEERIVEDLHRLGVEVVHQQENFKLFGGHFSGSIDGAAKNIPTRDPEQWHLLEFKTHGEKSFRDLERKGVKAGKPVHFAQMQVYMGGLELPAALYVAINKNTDEIYTEFLEFDEAVYRGLVRKAKQIIFSDEPPAKLSETPAYFECKFCPYSGICHMGEPKEDNYRNDGTHVPSEDGTWTKI